MYTYMLSRDVIQMTFIIFNYKLISVKYTFLEYKLIRNKLKNFLNNGQSLGKKSI